MNTKVKICGLTNLEDARAAILTGADLLGFIFYPKSPRYVPPHVVRDILVGLGSLRQKILAVGVFVNEMPDTVARTLSDCGLDLAQLHGDEPPEALGLSDAQSGSPLAGRAYKAFQFQTPQEATQKAAQYAANQGNPAAPAFLVDAYHPQLRGGTGRTADWQTSAQLALHYPLLLAGGITPQNAIEAVRAVQPWGIDVSSGVEASPGRKDHAALRALIESIRQ